MSGNKGEIRKKQKLEDIPSNIPENHFAKADSKGKLEKASMTETADNIEILKGVKVNNLKDATGDLTFTKKLLIKDDGTVGSELKTAPITVDELSTKKLAISDNETYGFNRFFSVATYVHNTFTNVPSGYCNIKIGGPWNDILLTMRISGSSYAGSWELTLSGLLYRSTTEPRFNVYKNSSLNSLVGDAPFTTNEINFLIDDKNCFYLSLGNAKTYWSPVNIISVDVELSRASASFKDGWEIKIEPTKPTHQFTTNMSSYVSVINNSTIKLPRLLDGNDPTRSNKDVEYDYIRLNESGEFVKTKSTKFHIQGRNKMFHLFSLNKDNGYSIREEDLILDIYGSAYGNSQYKRVCVNGDLVNYGIFKSVESNTYLNESANIVCYLEGDFYKYYLTTDTFVDRVWLDVKFNPNNVDINPVEVGSDTFVPSGTFIDTTRLKEISTRQEQFKSIVKDATGDLTFTKKLLIKEDGTVGEEVNSIRETETFVQLGEGKKIKASSINFSGLPIYEDDATAGASGLTQGDVYQTINGDLRIKL